MSAEGQPSSAHSRAHLIRHLIVGFLMGAADLVPGVSGGTIAFVGGIYERLLDAISDAVDAVLSIRQGFGVAMARFKGLDWGLILPLGLGLLSAVVSLASVIEGLLDSQPQRMAGLFCGMVLASVVISWGLLKAPTAQTVVVVLASAIAVFVFLGLQGSTHSPDTADAVVTAPWWAFPLSGAIAICAMILPGISGSFLLVMMGMYRSVLGAVNEREIHLVLLFVCGCAVGIAAFSRLLRWLLDTHHDLMVAVLIGLMLGSVRVLWPWPGGTATTELALPSGDVALPIVLSVVGFAVVFGLGQLGQAGPEAEEDEELDRMAH